METKYDIHLCSCNKIKRYCSLRNILMCYDSLPDWRSCSDYMLTSVHIKPYLSTCLGTNAEVCSFLVCMRN